MTLPGAGLERRRGCQDVMGPEGDEAEEGKEDDDDDGIGAAGVTVMTYSGGGSG